MEGEKMTILKCNECKDEISGCDNPNCYFTFKESDDIICANSGDHYCSSNCFLKVHADKAQVERGEEDY
jgi:hypothetical protein